MALPSGYIYIDVTRNLKKIDVTQNLKIIDVTQNFSGRATKRAHDRCLSMPKNDDISMHNPKPCVLPNNCAVMKRIILAYILKLTQNKTQLLLI
jgi:hypothetical protein